MTTIFNTRLLNNNHAETHLYAEGQTNIGDLFYLNVASAGFFLLLRYSDTWIPRTFKISSPLFNNLQEEGISPTSHRGQSFYAGYIGNSSVGGILYLMWCMGNFQLIFWTTINKHYILFVVCCRYNFNPPVPPKTQLQPAPDARDR